MDLICPNDPHAIALIDAERDVHVTYRHLDTLIDDYAPLFSRPKALAFLFISPSIECIAAYLALLKQAHAVAIFDSSLHPALKQRLIDLYRPDFVMAPAPQEPPPADYLPVAHAHSASLAVWRSPGEHSPTRLHPDLQLLLSTSGTTGSPKLIRLSQKNILSNAAAIVGYLDISPRERAITTLPYSYSYGLSVLHSHLLAGASVVLTQQSVVQAAFWSAADAYACTSMAGVPYTYQLLDRLGIEQQLPASLKTLTQAGGRLEPKLVVKFHHIMSQRNGRFVPMYGQTEATARIAYLPAHFLPEKAGAIGIAIPGGKLHLFDGGQEVLEANKAGEIVYEGDNVMLGYATQPADLALGDLLHGRLETGDVGFRDDEGVYFLTGRLKRISKVYGQRINLDEIEATLSAHGRVAAVSDDTRILIYFEAPGVDFEACTQMLARLYHLAPATFECRELPHLPLTVSGKIDYTQLRM